jgi:V8-like Glu-specific endopeptidase
MRSQHGSKVRRGVLFLTLSAVAAVSAESAVAQIGSIPSHKESFVLESLEHDNFGEAPKWVYGKEVVIPGARWLRLHFAAHDLGDRSYIRVSSVSEDAAFQVLTAEKLAKAGQFSAYFNGDAVLVDLYVGPGDEGVHFRIDEVIVGDWEDDPDPRPKDLCNGSDDRWPSTISGIGRIFGLSSTGSIDLVCTAFLASNGALVTAGHCADCLQYNNVLCWQPNYIVEFNVPAEQPSDCQNLTFADPEDQYVIDLASVRFDSGAVEPQWGDEWAVFKVLPNDGLRPQDTGQLWWWLTRELPPVNDTVNVVGYGRSYISGRCYSLQDGPGLYKGEKASGSFWYHEHQCDSTGGTSGAPIFAAFSGYLFPIGVHTDGGCSNSEYGRTNKGTSFYQRTFGDLLNDFNGQGTVYADNSPHYPAPQRDGTIFAPFTTVNQAVTSVPSGGIISLLPRDFGEAVTINKAVTLIAPVGTALIGQSAASQQTEDDDRYPSRKVHP